MVLFIVGLITWILLNIYIAFPCIVCALMAMLLEALLGKTCYILMGVHKLMGTLQGTQIALDPPY